MGLAENATHFFIPFHAVGGCGAFHLKSPIGGAAKGIPLKIRMFSSWYPSTFPYFVSIIPFCAETISCRQVNKIPGNKILLNFVIFMFCWSMIFLSLYGKLFFAFII